MTGRTKAILEFASRFEGHEGKQLVREVMDELSRFEFKTVSWEEM